MSRARDVSGGLYFGLADGGVQSTNFTAVSGFIYWIPANTTLTATLPATIAAKARIGFVIGFGAVVTLDPNGNKLNSSTSTYVTADPQTLFISVPDTATSGWC